jgi:hypothetical protein
LLNGSLTPLDVLDFTPGRLIRRVGLTVALVSFPAVCAVGTAAIAAWPSPSTVSLVEVIRKVQDIRMTLHPFAQTAKRRFKIEREAL